MTKYTTFLIGTLLSVLCSCTQTNDPSAHPGNFFPTTKGSTWAYHQGNKPYLYTMGNEVVIDGKTYFTMDIQGSPHQTKGYIRFDGTSIMARDLFVVPWHDEYKLMDTEAGPGQYWGDSFPQGGWGYGHRCTILSKNQTLTHRDRTYKDVTIVQCVKETDYGRGRRSIQTANYYWSRSTGLLKIEFDRDAGSVELDAYYPAPAASHTYL